MTSNTIRKRRRQLDLEVVRHQKENAKIIALGHPPAVPITLGESKFLARSAIGFCIWSIAWHDGVWVLGNDWSVPLAMPFIDEPVTAFYVKNESPLRYKGVYCETLSVNTFRRISDEDALNCLNKLVYEMGVPF